MILENPFSRVGLGELAESLLPDFVLALAFFTALVYAVLGKRLEHQRPAIAASASIGLALSIGTVWWEQQHGFSVRDLGPFAVGFAIIVLAGVMYQAIRQTGGSWAGVGIALGASLLVSRVLGLNWLVDPETLQSIMAVALVVGLVAFYIHSRRHFPKAIRTKRIEQPARKHRPREVEQGHAVSDMLRRRLHGIRKEAGQLRERPELAGRIVDQIRRTLPAEGWLTERMARLRAKAHQVRNGHIARLEETREAFAELPTPAKKAAAAELARAYQQLAGIDQQLERLDKVVAVNEKRIRELTELAQRHATRYDYRGLHDTLKAAEKLQKHNSGIFQTINGTETKLEGIAKGVAQKAQKVNDA